MQKLKEYGLEWTTRGSGVYFPSLVREFYTNYQATVEIMCKVGDRTSDKPLLTKVPVRGVRVDISDAIINRFLHGLAFVP